MFLHRSKSRTLNLTSACLMAAVLLPLAGCGPTPFTDSSLVVVGSPPPPPPEPEPEPKPVVAERVRVTADKIEFDGKIQFDTGKATIKEESFELLDEVVAVMQKHPEIKKVMVEGHTDSVGSEKSNQKLSDARAASVMEYLTSHGVDTGRLASEGFGESKPVGDNETDEGKYANRRVEFVITEQSTVEKVMEIDPKTGEKREVSREVKKDAPKATVKMKAAEPAAPATAAKATNTEAKQ